MWARSSQHRRNCRLKASKHSDLRIRRVVFMAWKNTVYPWGLRRQWGPRVRAAHGGGAKVAEAAQPSSTGGIPSLSREMECLDLTSATAAKDWTTSSGLSAIVLLRLPMVGKRMRRILYVWRKLTKRGKRLRYIRDMLPRKVRDNESTECNHFMDIFIEYLIWIGSRLLSEARPYSSVPQMSHVSSGLPYANTTEVNNVSRTGNGRAAKRLDQALTSPSENATGHPQQPLKDVCWANVTALKGQRRLGLPSHTVRGGEVFTGRRQNAVFPCHRAERADYIADRVTECPGNGSYLQLHFSKI